MVVVVVVVLVVLSAGRADRRVSAEPADLLLALISRPFRASRVDASTSKSKRRSALADDKQTKHEAPLSISGSWLLWHGSTIMDS